MKKIRIDASDRERVLLTDVLPYETPLFFSNEGFYRFCRRHLATTRPVVQTLLTHCQKGCTQGPRGLNTVPYGYEIRKGTLGTRRLSLLHPAVQLQIVALYERYAHVMLHLCTRSRFSLRYPASVATAVNGQPGTEDGLDRDKLQYGATYFKYEKYDMLYQFFESYEFQRFEKRYRHLRMFDISKCFDHIYTHTLSWAVRSKEFAKKNINRKSFDSEFDSIMQAANHKETAGILIGPEVSRVFAEIILQKIDTAVERNMVGKGALGRDYDVRRYVDDYYVFSNTREIGDAVVAAYHRELKQYRLDFNEAKSTAMVVPFMTSISCAKVALGEIVNAFFDALPRDVDEDEAEAQARGGLRQLRDPGRKANRLIQRIKAVIVSCGVEFTSVSGLLFSVIERRLERTITRFAADRNLPSVLYAVLDVSFFIYAMDVRVATTYKVGRIALHACKAVEKHPAEAQELIKKKIYDESRRILEDETRSHPEFYVETVNLLAILRVLGPQYRVSRETICEMISAMDRQRPEGELLGVDYFLVAALLFHMGDDRYYDREKTELLNRVLKLYEQVEDPSQRTDFTCLFLDLLRCPFVTSEYKDQLINRFRIRGQGLVGVQGRDMRDVVSSHQWFTDWSARDRIDVLLEGKRHRSPY